MTVTLQRLCRDRRGRGAQLIADELLHERIDVGIGADSAGNFTELYISSCMTETLQVPLHFLIPQCHLQSESRRFSMYPVCTSHHRRIFVGHSFIFQNRNEINNVLFQNLIGLLEQISKCGINNICGCQTVMHPFTFLPKALGHRTGEGNYIMACLLLNFIDPVNIKRSILTKQRYVFLWDYAQFRPSLCCTNFNFEPSLEFILFRPNGSHLRSAVTFDHDC
ncbi:hypothetical protein D3C72_999650 [compost metagenome]